MLIRSSSDFGVSSVYFVVLHAYALTKQRSCKKVVLWRFLQHPDADGHVKAHLDVHQSGPVGPPFLTFPPSGNSPESFG